MRTALAAVLVLGLAGVMSGVHAGGWDSLKCKWQNRNSCGHGGHCGHGLFKGHGHLGGHAAPCHGLFGKHGGCHSGHVWTDFYPCPPSGGEPNMLYWHRYMRSPRDFFMDDPIYP